MIITGLLDPGLDNDVSVVLTGICHRLVQLLGTVHLAHAHT